MANGYLQPRILEGTLELSRPAGGTSNSVLLDFGRKTTGYLFLELTGSTGDTILVESGPVRSAIVFRRQVKMPLDGQLWVDDMYIAARYLRLSLVSNAVVPQDARATLKQVGLRFSAWEGPQRGSFRASDPTLEKVWNMGVYTNQLCVQKQAHSSNYLELLPEFMKTFIRDWKNPYSQYVIYDGPRRDREAWLGDIRTEALALYGSYGAWEVVKASLQLFYDLQRNDGLMPGSGASRQEFREYNLWWVICLWELHLNSGDTAFTESVYPGFRMLMDWIEHHLDERGFLYNDRTWMWTFPREGHGIATQCILVETFRAAARLEKALEAVGNAERWEALADKIAARINADWWDEQRGVYRDLINLTNVKDLVFQDTNVYALCFGLATPERAARVLNYLKAHMWTPYGSATIDQRVTAAVLDPASRHYDPFNFPGGATEANILTAIWPHNRQIWPFVVGYEVEALFLAQRTDDALELIRRCWSPLVTHETGTFWEMIDADTGEFNTRPFIKVTKSDVMNSASHGWSGWIAPLMQKYLLGAISQAPACASPGWKTVKISPQPGALSFVEGRVPTQLGVVHVRVDNAPGRLGIDVTAPTGVTVVFAVADCVLAGRQPAFVQR